jgi:hypothetical protein
MVTNFVFNPSPFLVGSYIYEYGIVHPLQLHIKIKNPINVGPNEWSHLCSFTVNVKWQEFKILALSNLSTSGQSQNHKEFKILSLCIPTHTYTQFVGR